MYERLPSVYRNLDSKNKYQLKKYLEAIMEGGFDDTLLGTLNIMDIIDVDKCPSEYFPVLCESFGVEYYPDIGEIFQRKFLKNFVDLNIRKGTTSCIEYLVRELSGYDVLVRYDVATSRLLITIIIEEGEDINLLTKQLVINKYISKYIPVGLNFILLVSYSYSDEVDLVSSSTDNDSFLEETIFATGTLMSCTETEINAIVEKKGIEQGLDIALKDGLSLSNVIPTSPEWFAANNFSVIDIINLDGTQTILYN